MGLTYVVFTGFGFCLDELPEFEYLFGEEFDNFVKAKTKYEKKNSKIKTLFDLIRFLQSKNDDKGVLKTYERILKKEDRSQTKKFQISFIEYEDDEKEGMFICSSESYREIDDFGECFDIPKVLESVETLFCMLCHSRTRLISCVC